MLTVALISWECQEMKNEIQSLTKTFLAEEDFAVGNDLVFLPDFQKTFNDVFKRKVYTENEISYCAQFDQALLRYASTWAAKEATYKAIKQIDSSTLSWKMIEIVREKNAGKPSVILHKENTFKISLSISHDGDYVWAVVLVKRNL